MKLRDVFVFGVAITIAFFTSSCVHQRANKISSPATSGIPETKPAVSNSAPVVSAPVYVPDTSHENDPMPDGIFQWNGTMLATNISADADKAHFIIAFTNISPDKVAIMDVHPSCGCTTADVQPTPWIIPVGAHAEIPVSVNLEIAGNSGIIFKSVRITTDKGFKDIYLRMNFKPEPPMVMSDEQRAKFVMASRADRQAIFKGTCADCHVKKGEGKYGQALYQADCAICHEANPRATMVPDLHNLKVPTNPDFWRQWIAHGKPGSLMAAFSQAEGGPLNDMQIATLVQYLNETIPSKVAEPK
jgi:mono/diheme cytochrome c family protein